MSNEDNRKYVRKYCFTMIQSKQKRKSGQNNKHKPCRLISTSMNQSNKGKSKVIFERDIKVFPYPNFFAEFNKIKGIHTNAKSIEIASNNEIQPYETEDEKFNRIFNNQALSRSKCKLKSKKQEYEPCLVRRILNTTLRKFKLQNEFLLNDKKVIPKHNFGYLKIQGDSITPFKEKEIKSLFENDILSKFNKTSKSLKLKKYNRNFDINPSINKSSLQKINKQRSLSTRSGSINKKFGRFAGTNNSQQRNPLIRHRIKNYNRYGKERKWNLSDSVKIEITAKLKVNKLLHNRKEKSSLMLNLMFL